VIYYILSASYTVMCTISVLLNEYKCACRELSMKHLCAPLYFLMCKSVHVYHFASDFLLHMVQTVYILNLSHYIDDAMETRQTRGDAQRVESSDSWMDTYWLLSQTTKANFKCVCVCVCVCVCLRWTEKDRCRTSKGVKSAVWKPKCLSKVLSAWSERWLQRLHNSSSACSLSHRMPGMSSQYTLYIRCSVVFPNLCEPAQTMNVCSAVCTSTNTSGSHLFWTHRHTHTHTHTHLYTHAQQDINGGHSVMCHGREVRAHPSISTSLPQWVRMTFFCWGEWTVIVQLHKHTWQHILLPNCFFLALTSSQSPSSHNKILCTRNCFNKCLSRI